MFLSLIKALLCLVLTLLTKNRVVLIKEVIKPKQLTTKEKILERNLVIVRNGGITRRTKQGFT